jgi:hypothetical protein
LGCGVCGFFLEVAPRAPRQKIFIQPVTATGSCLQEKLVIAIIYFISPELAGKVPKNPANPAKTTPVLKTNHTISGVRCMF